MKGGLGNQKVVVSISKINSELCTEDQTLAEEIRSILPKFERHRGNLIPILQSIQERFLYLSSTAMEMVAAYLDMPPGEVFGVATFYNQFRFQPPGRHQIKVCLGTACHVAGGEIILENFERKLGIKAGETTPDREYSVERVACVGCCALAPVAIVDDNVLAHMRPSKVEGLFVQFETERERQEREKAEKDVGGRTGDQ